MSRGVWALAGAIGLVVVAGCGSSGDGSTFGSSGSSGDSSLAGGPGSIGSSGGADGTGADGGHGAGAVGNVTPGSACANSSSGLASLPAYLVFMYDRSISMGDSVGGGQTKWTACKAGLDAFFSDPASASIHASLTFFGVDSQASSADCRASSYVTPAVAMTSLPSASFGTQIGATGPTTDTPTLAALQGALQYAQTVKSGLTDGGKVAVVLVTDGNPHGCSGNTVAAVKAAAAASAATIPTYVIGIGKSLTNLNDIAAGGGTTAIMIDTATPAQVTADIQSAIAQIKAAQLGCDYSLPPPPAGQTLDVNAVNVDYTPGGGTMKTLAYSADCSDANGWHYDNPASPAKIITCPSICSTLQADRGGKVDIIFGCTTSVPPGGTLPR